MKKIPLVQARTVVPSSVCAKGTLSFLEAISLLLGESSGKSGLFLESASTIAAADVNLSLALGDSKHLTAGGAAEITMILVHHLGTLLTKTVGHRAGNLNKTVVFTAAFVVVPREHTQQLNDHAGISHPKQNAGQKSQFDGFENSRQKIKHQPGSEKKNIQLIVTIAAIHHSAEKITNHKKTSIHKCVSNWMNMEKREKTVLL